MLISFEAACALFRVSTIKTWRQVVRSYRDRVEIIKLDIHPTLPKRLRDEKKAELKNAQEAFAVLKKNKQLFRK